MRFVQIVCGPLWVAAIAAALAAPVRADCQATSPSQNAYAAPASSARLQVGGSRDSLSLDAERADVQATLRALLKQAGRQFAPEASVTGQVTLLLTDQPLETVLRAVCDACYLKYTETPTGIYKFSRDDEAVKKAFSQLSGLNVQLRFQLRAMGLDLPADEQLAASRFRSLAGAGAGGNGDATAASVDRLSTGTLAERGAPGKPTGAAGPQAAPGAGARRSVSPDSGLKREGSIGGANIHAYLVPQGSNNQLSVQGGLAGGQAYGAFVRQNGFVWFNIPEEKPEPVAAVLQLFSQQANVPILVDQSIPNSLRFRVWGSLSPRQLPEALNVLAPTAHLQWRWIGGSIFVVPAPNFIISFGDQAPTRNAYPAPARGEAGPTGDTKSRRGGSD